MNFSCEHEHNDRHIRRGSNRLSALFLMCALSLGSLGLLTGVSFADSPNAEVVDIQIDAKGNINTIKTKAAHLDPSQAGANMPVRVVTTYSYNGHSSSDPAVVEGKSGRIRMDVAVYNATGRMEQIRADVDGHAVKQPRWVSTPISVAASTKLAKIKPEQIITPTIASKDNSPVTNGIIGVDSNGNTTLQWAGLIGIDNDTARFSLVVDANDFQAPNFDILVQPGFGIDTNKERQRSRSEVVVATLKTLTDAGKVLADSGEALTRAREVLDNAGSQIGSKTITDLKASNSRVTSSASQIVATLNRIDSEISRVFSTTDLHVRKQLLSTTKAVKDLLGEPVRRIPAPVINTDSCTLTPPKNNDQGTNESVFEVVYGLSARLEALASTSVRCQQSLLNDIDLLLGPAQPDNSNCEKDEQNEGLSCLAWRNEQLFSAEMQSIRLHGEKLVAQLATGAQNDTIAAVKQLNSVLAEVNSAIDELKNTRQSGSVDAKLKEIHTVLEKFEEPFGSLTQALDEISDKTSDIGDTSQSQAESLKAAKRIICVASGATTTTDLDLLGQNYDINAEAAAKLLQLLADTSCPEEDPGSDASFDGEENAGGKESAEGLGAHIRQKVSEISEISAPITDETLIPSSRQALRQLRSAMIALSDQVLETLDARNNDMSDLDSKIAALEGTNKQLHDTFNTVSSKVFELVNHIDLADKDFQEYLQESHKNTTELLKSSKENMLTNINNARNTLSLSSDHIFEKFSAQIKNESSDLLNQSAGIITRTNLSVTESNESLSSSTSQLFTENTGKLGKVTDSAVLDTQAISALLAEDISRVLADIGTNANRGSGLLGAVATSGAHLGLADVKLATSVTKMSLAQSTQRSAQAGEMVDGKTLQVALSRLEQPLHTPSISQKNEIGWFSFHISPKRER